MVQIAGVPRTGGCRQKTNSSSQKEGVVTRQHRILGRLNWQAKFATGLEFQGPEAKGAAKAWSMVIRPDDGTARVREGQEELGQVLALSQE